MKKKGNKKKPILLIITGMLLLVSACSSKGTTFQATVLEANESTFLVQPLEGEDELRSSDQISISKEEAGGLELKAGDTVEIAYNGEILETYPARLGEVYSVSFASSRE